MTHTTNEYLKEIYLQMSRVITKIDEFSRLRNLQRAAVDVGLNRRLVEDGDSHLGIGGL